MPDVEPLRFPSREERPNQQDQAEFQAVCTGRRRTCALLNSPLPCVNNAIYHIQELKGTVEDWCQQSGKYPLRISREKHQHRKTFRFQSGDSDPESVTSVELFVEGIAISARVCIPVEKSCPLPPLLKKINDVLGEVVYLIERLEADRQHTEEALHKEKERKRFLENKVDSVTIWKQQEHAVVVQREHEACIRDISKLKWQLRREREKLDQAQEKLSLTEVWNQNLHEDINFARKQIPIVRENLELQRGLIDQLNSAQAEADEVCSKAQSDLLLAEKEKKQMQLDTNKEMARLDSELLAIKNKLDKTLGESDQFTVIEEGQLARIKDAEETIALTEKKFAATTARIPEMTELEKTENDGILQLKLQVEVEIQKNKKSKDKLTALQEDIEKTRLHGEAEVLCIEEQLLSKRNAFAALRQENMECEQNVEDYRRKMSESETAVEQMHEERKQMLQRIVDNDERWEKAEEEVTQVVARHAVTRAKLDEREKLTSAEEQRTKKEIEKLLKDLTGRRSALELLKGQCANKSEELYRQQRSRALTNQKLQKEFEDASTATKELETTFMKIMNLTEHFEKIQSEHGNTLVKLEQDKQLQRDHLEAAQASLAAAVERYDATSARISDLTKKTRDSCHASHQMEEMVKSMPEVIAELQSVFDVVDFKNKSAALIMSTLQSDINNCQQRTQRSVQAHTAHVAARKKEMEATKEALKVALAENSGLASEYEGLQRSLTEAKREEASALRDKNQAHKSFLYYTRLSLLQKRMHKALVKSFKQRSRYSRAELDRCLALSQETPRKIQTAQDGLSAEMWPVAALLQPQTDACDDGGMNKRAGPGWNE
ncbi:coiled-coil domain-containing protein 178 [Pungitius pungitius]|uniref:coiled-coil domain-containing protein 178 n=1 Tax=Pungitius pungitius TaxID=134920 RepID=UPI002E12763B